MRLRYDAICGLFCGACEVMLANKQGNVSALAQVWGVESGKLTCYGCKSSINAVYCRDCHFRICAGERGIEYCSQCSDFPCASLLEFSRDNNDHHAAVLQNLDDLDKMGLKQWLQTQQAKWSCPDCGTEFSWYDRICKTCGNRLFNCEEENKMNADGNKER